MRRDPARHLPTQPRTTRNQTLERLRCFGWNSVHDPLLCCHMSSAPHPGVPACRNWLRVHTVPVAVGNSYSVSVTHREPFSRAGLHLTRVCVCHILCFRQISNKQNHPFLKLCVNFLSLRLLRNSRPTDQT